MYLTFFATSRCDSLPVFPLSQRKKRSNSSFKNNLEPTCISERKITYSSSSPTLSSWSGGISGQTILSPKIILSAEVPKMPITSSGTTSFAIVYNSFLLFEMITLIFPVLSSKLSTKFPFFVSPISSTIPIIDTCSFSFFCNTRLIVVSPCNS